MRGVTAIEINAKSVLNRVRGMPFAWSINPYRGCYHQCVFCYARRTHTFFELDGVADWGSQIFVKRNAAAVLRRELARPSWRREHVAIGTATDPYQPLEGRYRITRAILKELTYARTPGHLTTRSPLVVRDIDVLGALCARAEFSVAISLPTLDVAIARELEPTVAPPVKRLAAVQRLAAAGIRVSVAVAPIVPHLTDNVAQMRDVISAARDAGATHVWHSALNLGETARDSFFAYLKEHHIDLIDDYRAMYRGKYLEGEQTDDLNRRYAAARRGIKLDSALPIEPDPEPAPLTLFSLEPRFTNAPLNRT